LQPQYLITGAAVARVELLQRLEQRSASLESQVGLSQTTKSWCEVNIFVNTLDDLDSTTVQVTAIVPASPWLTIYICYHLVMCKVCCFSQIHNAIATVASHAFLL